jgi:hypothetical protein
MTADVPNTKAVEAVRDRIPHESDLGRAALQRRVQQTTRPSELQLDREVTSLNSPVSPSRFRGARTAFRDPAPKGRHLNSPGRKPWESEAASQTRGRSPSRSPRLSQWKSGASAPRPVINWTKRASARQRSSIAGTLQVNPIFAQNDRVHRLI